jgi:hypothetical protein
MVKALQVVAGANAGNMTFRALVVAAQQAGVDLAEIWGAASAGELLTVAGGLGAAAYIGCLVGAAIAATASSVWGWADSVFSHDDATQNFQQISNTVSNYADVPSCELCDGARSGLFQFV